MHTCALSQCQQQLHQVCDVIHCAMDDRLYRMCCNLLIVQVVIRASTFLLLVLDRVHLVDARAIVCGVSPKRDVQVFEEQVHACAH